MLISKPTDLCDFWLRPTGKIVLLCLLWYKAQPLKSHGGRGQKNVVLMALTKAPATFLLVLNVEPFFQIVFKKGFLMKTV